MDDNTCTEKNCPSSILIEVEIVQMLGNNKWQDKKKSLRRGCGHSTVREKTIVSPLPLFKKKEEKDALCQVG